MSKRRYTSDDLLRDIGKLVVKRIKTLISDRKKEGRTYLDVYYSTIMGMDSTVVRQTVVAQLSSDYKVGYGVDNDKVDVSW